MCLPHQRWKIIAERKYRCTEQAATHGFLEKPTEWANLGQGAPEVDDEIEGCFPKPTSIPISVNGREYGPTAGIKPLRAAIANLYNDNYRQGKESQYSWENVCVVPGGRAGLIRIAAVLGNAYLVIDSPDFYIRIERLLIKGGVIGLLHTRLHGLQRDAGSFQECQYNPVVSSCNSN